MLGSNSSQKLRLKGLILRHWKGNTEHPMYGKCEKHLKVTETCHKISATGRFNSQNNTCTTATHLVQIYFQPMVIHVKTSQTTSLH